jgi:hypothetical protein
LGECASEDGSCGGCGIGVLAMDGCIPDVGFDMRQPVNLGFAAASLRDPCHLLPLEKFEES